MAQTTKSVTTLEIGEPESAFQIPVSLKKITTSTDVSLDYASPEGNPMETQRVDMHTGEVVLNDDVQAGVFRLKPNKQKKHTWGSFAPISEADLDTIKDATRIDNFTVEHFIPLAQVPFERVTGAYFLAPAEGMTTKPLVLLARALKRRKLAGVFKMVKASRQHLAVVYEKGGGLILNTLAFSADFSAVREAAEALARDTVKVTRGEQEMAETLLEVLTVEADVLDTYEDDLIPLKADLVERALQGKELPKRKKREAETVSDDGLEARLRATVEKASGTPPKAAVPVG